MAGRYKIEFGASDDRKAKLKLKQDDVMPAYDRLVAAAEHNVCIISPSGEILDPHQFRLDCKSVWVR